MPHSRPVDHEFEQALSALQRDAGSRQDKIEMLTQIAMGLQSKPQSEQQLHQAVALYDRATSLCHADEEALTVARISARKATALHSIPTADSALLLSAQQCLYSAIAVLRERGTEQETAEAYMNLGLVLQALAGMNRARTSDAIGAYQQALRTFHKDGYPAEYAILHNNLATAFLSVRASDSRSKMREALAVQSFEAALEVVSLIEQPREYAMLQNNLGNALQYVSSSHAVENNLRALDAYDEALKVRNVKDTPLEYANTISNRANCLRNLPDDPGRPEAGNAIRLLEASRLLQEAQGVFATHGEPGKAAMLAEALAEIRAELADSGASRFGEALIDVPPQTTDGARE